MSVCYSADDNGGKGFQLKRGDKICLDSWYWVGSDGPELAPHPGGTHLNVMGYMYAAYKVGSGKQWPDPATGPTPNAGCQEAIKEHCGHTIGFTRLPVMCKGIQKGIG